MLSLSRLCLQKGAWVIGTIGLFLLGCLCWGVNDARAEVRESIHYVDYDFEPRAGESIRNAALRASDLKNDDGTISYIGETFWRMQKAVDARLIDGECRILNHIVAPIIRVTLPRMQGGTLAQQQKFEDYLKRLQAHEQNHVQIVLDKAKALDRSISRLKPMRTCFELEEKVNELVKQYDDEAYRESVAYDVRTRHGQTEGL